MKSKSPLFTSFIIAVFLLIIGCSNSINKGSWKGKENIAGVGFSFTLTTNSDNTYTLVGDAGGITVDEKGTFLMNSENEIILKSGEWDGSKFIKENSSLKWYLDNGDFFMTLH